MISCDLETLFHDAMGELHGPARRTLHEHLAECTPCSLERDRWLRFVAETRSLAAVEIAPLANGTPETVAVSRTTALAKLAGIAAMALIGAGLVLFTPQAKTPRAERESLAARLRSSQGEDGSWAGQVGTTALATLALLENGAASPRGEDRERIENAIHFLTRPRGANSEEELLRGLVLLRENRRSSAQPSPQLQRAVDYAVGKSEGSLDAEKASLLREIVNEAHKAGLNSSAAEQRLGSFLSSRSAELPRSADWKSVSNSLAKKDASSEALPTLAVAATLLAVATPAR